MSLECVGLKCTFEFEKSAKNNLPPKATCAEKTETRVRCEAEGASAGGRRTRHTLKR